eukprot:3309954-Prymnesium_polylepis.1
MPGRPPATPQIRPMTHAACSATGGRTCAMNANAIDSEIWAKQMKTPSSTSRVQCVSLSGSSGVAAAADSSTWC